MATETKKYRAKAGETISLDSRMAQVKAETITIGPVERCSEGNAEPVDVVEITVVRQGEFE